MVGPLAEGAEAVADRAVRRPRRRVRADDGDRVVGGEALAGEGRSRSSGFGQLFSGGFVALAHGTNDAQKTMGIIALALVSSGHLNADFTRPPTWVIVSAALSMAAGTYAGGWRIIRTLGTRIAKIDAPQGFAAQTACASILWTTAHFGYPVSTTHVISGSVMGSGATRGLHAVRWGVAGNILVAWIFTIPMAALVGAFMELVTRLPGGDADRLRAGGAHLRRRLRGTPLGDPATAAGRGSRERPDLGREPDTHRRGLDAVQPGCSEVPPIASS